MPMQPPVFGRPSRPKKPWALAEGRKDVRKRGRAGQRDRRQVLAEEPFCRFCLKRGLSVASDVVDHIKRLADGGSDARSNKQALCHPCHDAKSEAERVMDRAARRDA